MGAAGPKVAVCFLIGPLRLLYIPLVVSIGWVRIKLNCHNYYQTYAGILLGSISTYMQIFLINKWFRSVW